MNVTNFKQSILNSSQKYKNNFNTLSQLVNSLDLSKYICKEVLINKNFPFFSFPRYILFLHFYHF